MSKTFNVSLPSGCVVSSMAQIAINPGGASLTVTIADTAPAPTPGVPFSIKSSLGGYISRLTGSFTTLDGQPRPVDVTSFMSVFNLSGHHKVWPCMYGVWAGFSLACNKYISLAFVATELPAGTYGSHHIGETLFQHPVSMTISTAPGDFSNPNVEGSTVLSGCYINQAKAGQMVKWNSSQLTPGKTYYLNMVVGDISGVLPNGGGQIVPLSSSNSTLPVFNGWGNWSADQPAG